MPDTVDLQPRLLLYASARAFSCQPNKLPSTAHLRQSLIGCPEPGRKTPSYPHCGGLYPQQVTDWATNLCTVAASGRATIGRVMVPSRFVLCDVFTERPFAGNPLAVFSDYFAHTPDAATMLAVAREFGWSEVTFVQSRGEDRPPLVRIWTPHGELPFAGHPTIGTAIVLAASGVIDVGWNVLELGLGPIAVEVTSCSPAGGSATMVQQAPRFEAVLSDRIRAAAALGLDTSDLVAELPVEVVSTGSRHLMVPVATIEALSRAQPEPGIFPAMTAGLGVRWAYVFCTDTPGTAAAARARLLQVGREDPATGSAAGALAAYLVRYGIHQAGELDIEQGVEIQRPSRIIAHVPLEDGEIGPVRVSGNVHIWGEGTVSLPVGLSLGAP